MIRLVVCIDYDTDDLAEAYRQLSQQMKQLGENVSWESSDEWYGSDGEEGDQRRLQAARMQVWREDHPGEF